ncbi:hypothetical protein HZA71_02530 [Candidatus Falkowbacteria bacterium]|nr:hypothetical protein [Candidatus Falkowbacteria bacterium]
MRHLGRATFSEIDFALAADMPPKAKRRDKTGADKNGQIEKKYYSFHFFTS